jgi:hypothetical protein
MIGLGSTEYIMLRYRIETHGVLVLARTFHTEHSVNLIMMSAHVLI